jgi:3-oxoacyl-[acyl-carrier protein] reductase
MGRLDGRVAIITGGAQGIGAETARVFASEGARTIVWDTKPAPGDGLEYATVDVTSSEDVGRATAAVVERHGRIDILVNNAGIARDSQLVRIRDGVVSEMSEPDFDAVISVNLKGVFVCTRAIAPVMIRNGFGRILIASSVVGVYGNFGQTNYAATKAGVIGMTRVWARELGPKGITVNCVAPGFIDTDMTRAVREDIRAGWTDHTPVRRVGLPRDVALAYLFLASDDAGFVNGAVLPVDGGLVLGT